MKDPENLAEHLRLSFELVATLADGILARFDATGENSNPLSGGCG
jgi:hypothetical protein